MEIFDIYAAVFTYANDGITVTFPDFPDAVAEGETNKEAFCSAKEALEGWIGFASMNGESIPKATPIENILHEHCNNPNESVFLIPVDNQVVNKITERKKIRRNVMIPEYLSKAANAHKLNVSQITTNAIKAALNL